MFRRSKLSFLTTKDDRIKIFNERINLTEKHLNEMCSGFALCTRKLAKYRDSYDELAKTVNHYIEDEELNASLTDGLKNFSNAVTVLGDFMDLNVHRMELKIINELSQFEMLCKNTRENLRTAVIARDKEVLKQRQMLDLKAKFTGNNAATDSELLKAKIEVTRTNKEIDEIINKFEKRKLDDLKAILADFVLLSMKYHTKSLEALSATYYDITKIDEQDDYRVFQKLLKSKSNTGLENAGTSKSKLAFRSQSMESLDRDKLLNPVIGLSKSKLSKSTRNLSDTIENNQKQDMATSDDDDEEEDSNENDDDDNDDEFDEGSEDVNTDDDEDDNTSDISSKADGVEQFKSQFSPIKIQQSQYSKPEIKNTFRASSSNSLNQVLKPIEPLSNSRRSNSALVSKRLNNTTAGIQHSKAHQPYNEEDNSNNPKTRLFKIGGSSGANSEATLVTVVESKHSNADNSGQ